MNKYFSPKEVADMLSVKIRTIYILIRRSELKAIRIGRALRISPESLSSFIAHQAEKGSSNGR